MIAFPEHEAFRVWLESRRDDVVGLSAWSGWCPLAYWLDALTGEPVWTVDAHSYRRPGQSAPLPAWASAFVQSVERHHWKQFLTGEQALAVLDEVLEEQGRTDEVAS